LFIELGKPLKSGDMLIKFVTFDPNAEIQSHDLFTIPLSSKLTVREAKVELVEIFHERQKDEKLKINIEWDIGKPENLRLREINLNPINPRTIYLDDDVIKKLAGGLMFRIPEIAIQKLGEGVIEPKQSKDTIIFFVQEFNPETFTLSPRFELSTWDNETLTAFREKISRTTNIPQIGLADGGGWLGRKRLDIAKLKWNVVSTQGSEDCAENEAVASTPVYDTSRVRSLNISDGDLVLYQNMALPLKQPSREEEKEIDEKDRLLRTNLLRSSGRSSKSNQMQFRESKLVIHQKDVRLEDEDEVKST